MTALVLMVLLGLGMAFFATQNTEYVNLTLGNYTIPGVSLYVVILGSMLFGIVVSWLISMANGISSSMTIHGKESAIKDAQKTIVDLKREIRRLEVENASLRGENSEVVMEESIENKPSFINRLTGRFTRPAV